MKSEEQIRSKIAEISLRIENISMEHHPYDTDHIREVNSMRLIVNALEWVLNNDGDNNK